MSRKQAGKAIKLLGRIYFFVHTSDVTMEENRERRNCPSPIEGKRSAVEEGGVGNDTYFFTSEVT